MNKSSTNKLKIHFDMMFKLKLCFLFIFLLIIPANGQTTIERKLGQHVYTLASDLLEGRKSGTQHSRMASEYIIKQWEEIGVEPYYDTSFLQTFHNNNFQNIVGIIRGNDSVWKNEYIIVGAHYDHLGVKNGNIYNGADDNASGVATLIELARKLKNEQANLKRSIILVAFDAEELGLIGSTHFAKHIKIPSEDIKLMISIDMVGWYKASGKVEYIGSGTMSDGEKILMNPQLVPAGLNVVCKKFETSIFTATDTAPFASKGISTLAVTTGFKSPYHKPEDEADLIDYDGMAMITEHLKNIIVTISQDINYEPSGKIARKHRSSGISKRKVDFGLSANIGTNYHHYTDGAIDGKTSGSFGMGLMSQINFGPFFGIRPEVHYDRITAKHPAGKIEANNLTTPLNLVLHTAGMDFGMDLFVGLYYSHCFYGTQGSEVIDFENTFNRNEFGYTFGFGVRIGSFKMGATTRSALTNFTKNANMDNAHIRNKANYFTISYVF